MVVWCALSIISQRGQSLVYEVLAPASSQCGHDVTMASDQKASSTGMEIL